MASIPQVEPVRLEMALIDSAADFWRLARVFDRALGKLDAGEGDRYASQLRYFRSRLDDHLAAVDLRLVSVEGQPFDSGMAATALNIADFDPDDELFVDQMVEPIVVGSQGVRREGTLMVRRATA